MEQKQKDHIRKNLPSLIRLTDCSINVLSELLSKNVLDFSDVNALKTHTAPDDQVYQLYGVLATRTDSFEALIDALEKTTQTGAVDILKSFYVNPDPDPDLVKVESENLQKRRSCCQNPDSSTSIAIKVLDVIIDILKTEAVPDDSLGKIQEIVQQRTVIEQIEKIVRFRCCCEANPGQAGNGDASKTLTQEGGEYSSNMLLLNILGSKLFKALQEQYNISISKINFVSPDERRVSKTSEIIQVEPIFATELSHNSANVTFNNSQLELLAHITLSSNTCPFAALTKAFKQQLKEYYLKLIKVELNTLKTTHRRSHISELVQKNDAVLVQVLKKFDGDSENKTMRHCLISSYMKKCFWKRVLTSNLLSVQVESDLDSPVLGIDLGTDATSAGYFSKNNSFHNLIICGKLRIPSYLHFDPKGRATICADKYRTNVIFDIKHLLGMSGMQDKMLQDYLITRPFEIMEEGMNFVKVKLNDNSCYFPEEILATYLIKLIGEREFREFRNVVLTVPNMFNSRQRMAVLNSMRIARISNCEIVNEGTAAIFAYANEQLDDIKKWKHVSKETIQNVGYFSFGGGCLNISLAKVDFINKTIEVLAQGGDAYLGGRNIDKSLLELCVAKLKESEKPTFYEMSGKEKDIYRNINGKLKDIKETLPSNGTATFDVDGIQAEITLFASDLNNICKPIVDYADKMMKIIGERKNVNRIILNGGLSRMEIMLDKIHESFGEGVTSSSEEDLITNGAALFGCGYDNIGNSFRLVPNEEILPFHMNAQFIWPSSTLKPDDLLHVADKNDKIPLRRTLTPGLRDPSVQLLIFQSESRGHPREHLVGEYEIPSKNISDSDFAEVVIALRRNCTLQVQACYKNSDSRKEDIYVILENKLDLSEQKISELADKLKY